jgi:hypothetical protein
MSISNARGKGEQRKWQGSKNKNKWWCLTKVETSLTQIIVEDMHRMMKDFLMWNFMLKILSIIFNLSCKLLTFLVWVWIF